MKKIFNFLLIFFLTIQCSFDNKTGIWTEDGPVKIVDKKESESKDISKLKKNKKFKISCAFIRSKEKYKECLTGEKRELADAVYEEVFAERETFNAEINPGQNYIVSLEKPSDNTEWAQKYLNFNNNISNISYNNKKQKIFKSKKLSNFKDDFDLDYRSPHDILIYNNQLVSYDHNGSIYIYSPNIKKKTFTFNFYKKKYKKNKKKLYLVIKDNKLYVSDSLGFMYSLDLNNGKLLWAQNFGIPFRSNIKIIDNQLLLANQDNIIYSVDRSNGETNWRFATTLTFLKSFFTNSLLVDKKNDSIIFLNTSGELYSINYINQKINWVLNFMSSGINEPKLFFSLPLTQKENNLIISTGNTIVNFDPRYGAKKWSTPISTNVKYVLTKKNIFLVTSNNLLVCLDISSGEIIWSKNVYKEVLKIKKKLKKEKIGFITNLNIADNEIILFSSKGYILSFNHKIGAIKNISKFGNKGLGSNPLYANGYMYLFNKNNKILIYE